MIDRNNQCSQTFIDHQHQDKKIDQSTDNKVNLLNYDMDDGHHDEDVSLEDAEIEKDTTDSNKKNLKRFKMMEQLILIQCLYNNNSNNKKKRKTKISI